MMGGGGSYTPAFGKGQEEIARREAEGKQELAKATAVRRNLFIIDAIRRSAFIIGDLSVPKPNVSYELGYAL